MLQDEDIVHYVTQYLGSSTRIKWNFSFFEMIENYWPNF